MEAVAAKQVILLFNPVLSALFFVFFQDCNLFILMYSNTKHFTILYCKVQVWIHRYRPSLQGPCKLNKCLYFSAKKRKCLVFDLLTWYLLIFLLQDALLWNSFKRNPLNSLSPLSIFVLFFIWLLIYGHVQSTSSHSIQSMTKDLEQTKGINQNWSGAKNFYNCFCVIFDCFLKKVISRRNTGH